MSVTSTYDTTRLRGRLREFAVLDELLGKAQAGTSGMLVLSGEPGIGKSALLDYVASRAEGIRVDQVCGVQSEMELPFAGLHLLFGSLLDRLERLPGPQREALEVALGCHDGREPDRLLVGLAVLSMMAELAEEQPLACLIDDAQWLDQSSCRHSRSPPGACRPTASLLSSACGRAATFLSWLKPARAGSDKAPRSGRARAAGDGCARAARPFGGGPYCCRDTRQPAGNPAVPAEAEPGRPGRRLRPSRHRWPPPGRIEDGFRQQVESLPPGTRQLLLTAAAERTGDVTLLWRAAASQGIGTDAAAPAEAAELVELGAQLRFSHPLVRSATYQSATPDERRTVHRALAEATDPVADPDRRAWHRSQAATGPDEEVAAELERSAGRAQARGGLAAAAEFLRLATELTPELQPPQCPRPRRSASEVQGRLLRTRLRAAGDCGGRATGRPAAGTARAAPRPARLLLDPRQQHACAAARCRTPARPARRKASP